MITKDGEEKNEKKMYKRGAQYKLRSRKICVVSRRSEFFLVACFP